MVGISLALKNSQAVAEAGRVLRLPLFGRRAPLRGLSVDSFRRLVTVKDEQLNYCTNCMAIVTVKNKYQVVIPRAVRKELGINPGDLLEAKVERGKLTYTRKALIDQIPANKAERERYFNELRANAPAWLKEIWAASKRRGTDKLTPRQINRIIDEARREHSRGKVTKRANEGGARHQYSGFSTHQTYRAGSALLLLAVGGKYEMWVSAAVLRNTM